LGFLGVLLCYS